MCKEDSVFADAYLGILYTRLCGLLKVFGNHEHCVCWD